MFSFIQFLIFHRISYISDLQKKSYRKIHHAANSSNIRKRKNHSYFLCIMKKRRKKNKIWERWRRYIIRHTICTRVWVNVLCAFGGNTSGETLVRYFERRGKKAAHFFPFRAEKEERQKNLNTNTCAPLTSTLHTYNRLQYHSTDLEHMKKNREKFLLLLFFFI